MARMYRKTGSLKNRFEKLDFILLIIMTAFAAVIIIPFINVIGVSFSSAKEYTTSSLLLFPSKPTLRNYAKLFEDGRIYIGYRTTIIFLLLGVPVSIFLTFSMAYGLSRHDLPGGKVIFFAVLFSMLFNGGIVPLYLLMRQLHLLNTIWSVILAGSINTFYLIVTRTYFQTIPQSLIESAKLDGASEWRILFQIIIPLSMPIIATIILFYSVDKWNEYYNAMIFIRNSKITPLQLILRSIVIDSQAIRDFSNAADLNNSAKLEFTEGIRMACVMVVMLPVMCVFPFLQKYFVKGMLIGAIKS
ncbi:MAG: carbohydrate ABC transporter permease [Treponema sp.]|jgi:putative aldouronate transport system permease protein|nr:carbohydrate ABC transporter permease [Treponema sp.]